MFWCNEIPDVGLASALRERPTLRNCPSLSEIKMERIGSDIVENFESFAEFGVYPQLKSLYLECTTFTTRILTYFESFVEFGVYPQLKSLYLGNNTSWLSDESIIMFASIFPNLQLLDLNSCNRISEVPNLEVLNLSNTNVDDETLYVISKNCCGLLKLLLDQCGGFTKKGVKHVLKNCRQLREHGYIIPSSLMLQV
ncbi:F-box/LRR-repeat protein [Trifolium pratense]|uniref:F-box/LRR-repeat protein n=1 Tax=Trifolium pratense TaxID=57577 RepID=A0A2K3LYE6_TRIPR|nr:F-box/LRR-repeat protein [Trifolium pratense]